MSQEKRVFLTSNLQIPFSKASWIQPETYFGSSAKRILRNHSALLRWKSVHSAFLKRFIIYVNVFSLHSMYAYMFVGNKCALERGESALHILSAKCELIPRWKIFGVQQNYICIWHVVSTVFLKKIGEVNSSTCAPPLFKLLHCINGGPCPRIELGRT